MTDTERVEYLENVLRDIQNANTKLFYNDDPDAEDDDGALLPVGFTFFAEGTCGSVLCLTEPTLRGLIEMMAAVHEDSEDVE